MSGGNPNTPNSGSVPANDPGKLNIATQADFGPSKSVWALMILFLGIAVGLALLGVFQGGHSIKPAATPVVTTKIESKNPLPTNASKPISSPAPKTSIPNEGVVVKEWQKIVALGKKAFLDGDYAAAEKEFLRAVEVSKTFKRTDRLVTTLNNLAAVYQVEKKYPAAESLYTEAIDLLKKDGSPSRAAIDRVLKNYNNLLRGIGRNKDADRLQREADWINGRPVLL